MDRALQAQADAKIRQQVGVPGGSPGRVAPSGQPTPPGSPAPPPAADPRLDQLMGELRNLQNQIGQRDQMLQALQGEIVELRRVKEEPTPELPSDESLDELPRGEAIRRVAGVIAAKAVKDLRGELVGAMGRMAVDVIQSRNALEEQELTRTFPGLDIEKYRPAIDRKRAEMPGARLSELVRLVADPNDLVAKPPDTTRATQEAVHMETGGASRAGVRRTQEQTGPTEQQLHDGFLAARQAGNKLQADAYLMEIIKRRPDVPAQHGGRPTGG